MNQPLVLLDVMEDVAVLTLNQPEKRNALSTRVLEALSENLRSIAANSQIHVVILRATGSVFSAGHDLRELVGKPREDYVALFSLCTQVMESIRTMPQPVIAQVQGLATAAGCQLAATCDLVVASQDAAFATPGVKIGLFCTTPAVALVRAVTHKKAMEMLLTGNVVSAAEAERIGLVNRVVPSERLADETMSLAKEIAASSSSTIAIGKTAFYEQLALGYPQAYELAEKTMVENTLTEDAQEGIKAFLEKRKPIWKSP